MRLPRHPTGPETVPKSGRRPNLKDYKDRTRHVGQTRQTSIASTSPGSRYTQESLTCGHMTVTVPYILTDPTGLASVVVETIETETVRMTQSHVVVPPDLSTRDDPFMGPLSQIPHKKRTYSPKTLDLGDLSTDLFFGTSVNKPFPSSTTEMVVRSSRTRSSRNQSQRPSTTRYNRRPKSGDEGSRRTSGPRFPRVTRGNLLEVLRSR